MSQLFRIGCCLTIVVESVLAQLYIFLAPQTIPTPPKSTFCSKQNLTFPITSPTFLIKLPGKKCSYIDPLIIKFPKQKVELCRPKHRFLPSIF